MIAIVEIIVADVLALQQKRFDGEQDGYQYARIEGCQICQFAAITATLRNQSPRMQENRLLPGVLVSKKFDHATMRTSSALRVISKRIEFVGNA